MVARLEDTLGVPLFTRSRQGLQLTEDGALLQAAVSAGFSQMQGALREIRRRRAGRGTVTLSLTSGFVSHWLMPRYARFQQAVPGVNLRFEVVSRVLQGDVDGVDLGLRIHDPERNWQEWPFCPEVVMPLCSPGYLRRVGSLDKAKDLAAHTLIHLGGSPFGWEQYGERVGLDGRTAGHTLAFTDGALVLQAAMIGEGVSLGWLSATSAALRERLLVPASKRLLRTGRQYSVVARPGPVREEVARVRDWLIAQMQDDLVELARRHDALAQVLAAAPAPMPSPPPAAQAGAPRTVRRATA
jgi:DNA-binding transcriptional LysR family regulator